MWITIAIGLTVLAVGLLYHLTADHINISCKWEHTYGFVHFAYLDKWSYTVCSNKGEVLACGKGMNRRAATELLQHWGAMFSKQIARREVVRPLNDWGRK